MLRSDVTAATNLFERAASLGEIDLGLELDLINTLFSGGRMEDASKRAAVLGERGAASGNRVLELCGRLREALIRQFLEPEGATEKVEALAEEAIPVFEASGDDLALYLGHYAVGMVAHMRARFDDEVEALDRALGHARSLGLPHLEAQILPPAGAGRLFGTTPVPDLVAWIDEQEARGVRHTSLRGHRAAALAMLGRFDEARELLNTLRTELAERGAKVPLALMTGHAAVDLELMAGDAQAAAGFGEEGCRLLEEIGERSWLSTVLGKLAEAYLLLGRLEEAEAQAARGCELGASDDFVTQIDCRLVQARVLARRGQHADAERLAREAVSLGERTDLPEFTYLDLAEVLELAGRPSEAAEVVRQALAAYERKGIVPMVARARNRRDALLLQLDQ
jgi:tetratricopeptide (TPR) repeat protein